MPRYSRDEMERAFERYQDMGLAAARSGDWSLWGDMFTEDCAYHEHSLGEWGGREAVIREMAALMHKTGDTPWIWCNLSATLLRSISCSVLRARIRG